MANNDTSEEVRGNTPSSPPRENLVRATPGIHLDRAAGDGMPTMTGHFAVWDQWTEIRSAYEGNFLERFAPSSMTRTLAQSTPKVLFQHGKDPQIGEKPLGTVARLAPDDTGAAYQVPLFDTQYVRELLPGLEAGVYGASFRFSVVREDVVARPRKSDYNPRGLPERTVVEAKVMEFGPVTFPAYAGATAGVRSMTDEFLFATLARDAELPKRTGISLAGVRSPFAQDRADTCAITTLTQMVNLGAWYISDQDDPAGAEASAMTGVLTKLTGLIQGAIDAPTEDPEDSMPTDGMYSATPDGEQRNDDVPDSDPDPSGGTTRNPGDPEPPVATTRTQPTSHFWFVETPLNSRSK